MRARMVTTRLVAVVDGSLVVEVTPSPIRPAAVGKGEPSGRRQGDTQCHNECRLSEPIPRGECRQWSFAPVHLTSLGIHLECCDMDFIATLPARNSFVKIYFYYGCKQFTEKGIFQNPHGKPGL